MPYKCKIAHNANKLSWYYRNKDRCRKSNENWRKRNKDRTKLYSRKSLMKRYGLTIEDYDRMISEQGNKCALCGDSLENSKKRPAVDHCHKTGKVRAILHHACNMFLGFYEKNKNIINNIPGYLGTHEVDNG